MSAKIKTDIKDRFVIIMTGGRSERFLPGMCAFDRSPRFC
jgi:hypothetical protein